MFVSEYFYRKINITPGTVNNFSPPRHLSSITGMHRLFVIQIKRQRTTVPSIWKQTTYFLGVSNVRYGVGRRTKKILPCRGW